MDVQQRIDLLVQLGNYILSDESSWKQAKQKAAQANNWFTQEFIERATSIIAQQFLQRGKLEEFAAEYRLEATNPLSKTVGLVMAGNIPLVGFHDWLCLFLAGHRALIKASSKDEVLIKHLTGQLAQWNPAAGSQSLFADMLKACDAYIATGSNNTSRYFEYYFGKYPHIIRRNRTSVAVLTGHESSAELENLADDVHLYFGLGCRNVTKLYVPPGYDFVPLLDAFNKWAHLINHHKYKNNYDYQLAIYMLNNQYYMTNGSVLLVEDSKLFSPISQVNYAFYENEEEPMRTLQQNSEVQCIVGNGTVPFGQAQVPTLTDYADGVDTMQFALDLNR
ncbi:MAG: acyl-CoA reductase [Williamsia sp.]|nr:acyl-CoA reductase [Williamsia sp.]